MWDQPQEMKKKEAWRLREGGSVHVCTYICVFVCACVLTPPACVSRTCVCCQRPPSVIPRYFCAESNYTCNPKKGPVLELDGGGSSCDLSTLEEYTEESGVQSQPCLPNEFKDSLGYIRPYIKTSKRKIS